MKSTFTINTSAALILLFIVFTFFPLQTFGFETSLETRWSLEKIQTTVSQAFTSSDAPLQFFTNEQHLFQKTIESGGVKLFLMVFLAGLLTNLTPCTYPMIPITVAILGNKDEPRLLKRFYFSLLYVSGIAITYSFLGIIAALSGSLFGSVMSHPLMTSLISLFFIMMGLSMFGLFDLQLPNWITRVFVNSSIGTGHLGVFLAGITAGLIFSPCLGPVLASVLTLIAHGNNLILGSTLMLTFSLGLGLVYLVFGTFTHLFQYLPKNGPWLNISKYVFGIIMILAAIYISKPVIAQYISLPTSQESNRQQWTLYSEDGFQEAIESNKPVILEFSAEWCQACKDLEGSFSDPEVQKLTQHFKMYKFDATNVTSEFMELQQKYNIQGFPLTVFYDQSGKYRPEFTLLGYAQPHVLANHLKSVTNAAPL